jgi:hypothetical protein
LPNFYSEEFESCNPSIKKSGRRNQTQNGNSWKMARGKYSEDQEKIAVSLQNALNT